MLYKLNQKTLMIIAILLVASLGGGYWIGLSHTRVQLLSEIEELKLQIDSLTDTIDTLSSENEDYKEQLGIKDSSENDYKEQLDVDDIEPVILSSKKINKTSLAKYYNLESPDIQLFAAQYKLPIVISECSNYQSFSSKISLSDSAILSIGKNGFVVINNPYNNKEEDITQLYKNLKDEEIPIFITSDSVLHIYHIQFDETLRRIEETVFFEDVWDICEVLMEDSIEKYSSFSGDLKEASKRNIAFFAVCLSLLQPKVEQACVDTDINDTGCFTAEDLEKYSFSVPEIGKEIVENELALIEEHKGFSQSPIFVYSEDYSQYVPRGHYTRSERLKNYFKALMWFGRMSLLLKGSDKLGEGETCSVFPCEALVSTYDAKIQTIQACLIASKFAEHQNLKNVWDRIYTVTSSYVGYSDDLGPDEYIEVMNSVFNGEIELQELNDETIEILKSKLAEYWSPKIYGGTGMATILPPFTPEKANEVLDITKGFRIMGQRFTPDAYIFQNLVAPQVTNPLGPEKPFTYVMSQAGPIRGFPRGLDVMAILGSERASDILENLKDSNYVNYSRQFSLLKNEFNEFSDEDWNKNLYWSWLYTLKPLLKVFDEGYPTFMQTQAWRNKELTTALASWAELKHDTILYAKQSYTPLMASLPEEKPVFGYVEPVPEFYLRLLSLTKMTSEGLNDMGVLNESAMQALESLDFILTRLSEIAEKELRNEQLSQEDYDFISNFSELLEDTIADVDERARKTTVVADVHTDQNTRNVLEEAVGYVKVIIVAIETPDGDIQLCAGPVLSYYEFKQDMSERLTDEAWRDLLSSDPPDEPEWISDFTS